jgi:hypothetical protein
VSNRTPGKWVAVDHISPQMSVINSDGVVIVRPRYKDGSGRCQADMELCAAAPDLDLMLWALTHGWSVQPSSHPDGKPAWMWVSPSNNYLYVLVSRDDRPCIDDAIRTAMMEDRNR